MTKVFVLFFLCCLEAIKAQNIQKIEEVFPMKWKTYIGQTTYRSNILFHQGKIWLGSNGNTLERSANDENDAVFVLDTKNGQILSKIKPISKPDDTEIPDFDVNGIAIEGNKLFFGTDYKTLYCYDTEKKEFLWQYHTPSDAAGGNYGNIESCPLLVELNGDGESDVVITVRGKGVVAVNGKTGKPLWLNILSQAEGAFLTSPCAIDVNKDNIPDIITGGWSTEYASYLYALDGKTGKILWQFNLGSGLKSSPSIIHKGKKTAILVATTYSIVYMVGLNGKVLYAINLSMPEEAPFFGGISGLFASPILTPNETLGIGTSWWSSEQDGLWISHLQKAMLKEESRSTWEGAGSIKMVDKAHSKFFSANRISASAVVAQISNKNWQIIVPTEKGKLMIYDEKNRSMQILLLPAGSETTPFVGDIDGDGKLELLLATYDGYLYCYGLSLKKAKVFIGQFRQDNKNQATIRLK
ncbi:MAG: hypothetical protein OHK0045_01560 [Raineya sp.]